MRAAVLIFLITMVPFVTGCGTSSKREVIFFHAGSLAVPVARLAEGFEAQIPGIRIITEAAGSLVTARKITELGKPCDIMASADYIIIDELLIPEHASWNIGFATNEIVIAYTPRSGYSDEINSLNWTEILLKGDVYYGRSDPDSDPCGYRTLLMLKLAEEYYDIPGLTGRFMEKDRSFIRPKEIDLTALLEARAVDYVFQYKSVAVQHGLKYITLPPEINLGNNEFRDNYRSVSVDVAGRSPGERMIIQGDYILYGITLVSNSPNRDDAVEFLAYILGPEGREIIRRTGQNPVEPPVVSGSGELPVSVGNAVSR
ncbi:MAG: extracellular solute-binding protein [Bacteroidetes bacterium]|nr:extracellular solute-binding protein [Bacteroidota bacterium]